MRRFILSLTLAALIWCLPSGETSADVSLGVSLDEDGLRGFHLAIGEHYNVPEKEVVVVRQKNVPDEELPVVFYLARQASVSPETIIKLRLGGKSWMEITAHLGFTAEMYYVPVSGDHGPPYGKAYGHFKKNKKTDWGAIKLSDAEIVNFVNLKFISDHHGYSPDEVIKMRSNGKSFISINTEVKKNKGKGKKNDQALATNEDSKAKGKGKKK
jgi:hypothetical protein